MHDDRLDPDLARRLRAYESQIPGDEAPPPGGRRSRGFAGWWVLGLGGAAVAAAGLFLAVTFLNLPSAPAGQSSSSPTPALASSPATSPEDSPGSGPSGSAQPSGSALSPAHSVERIFDISPDFYSAAVMGLVRYENRLFVAVTNHFSGTVTPVYFSGAIYRQAGPSSWERVDDGSTFRDERILSVTARPNGPLVVGGYILSGPPRNVDGVGAFSSTDGVTWVPLADPPPCLPTSPTPTGGEVCVSGRYQADSAIHLSDDGLRWTTAFRVSSPDRTLLDVGAGPEGFVAVGDAGRSPGNPQIPFVVASNDGKTWLEAPAQPAFVERDFIIDVEPFGPDWVAVGTHSEGDSPTSLRTWAVVWRSANGLNWERVAEIGESGSQEAPVTPSRLIVAGDHLFLDLALAAEGSDTRPRGVWESTDGRSWRQLDLGPEAEVNVVVEDGTDLLLGGRSSDSDGHAVIWRVRPEFFDAP